MCVVKSWKYSCAHPAPKPYGQPIINYSSWLRARQHYQIRPYLTKYQFYYLSSKCREDCNLRDQLVSERKWEEQPEITRMGDEAGEKRKRMEDGGVEDEAAMEKIARKEKKKQKL